jgi:phasin
MPKDGNANFEIPAEMRSFAEKSVAQAKVAFDSFIAAAQQAANTAETHAQTARVGAKETSNLAMQFAERNIASSFDFAQRLLQAKDPQEVAQLHAEYVKSQVTTLSEQAKELGQQAVKMTGQGNSR